VVYKLDNVLGLEESERERKRGIHPLSGKDLLSERRKRRGGRGGGVAEGGGRQRKRKQQMKAKEKGEIYINIKIS